MVTNKNPSGPKPVTQDNIAKQAVFLFGTLLKALKAQDPLALHSVI